jgi:membrane-associated protein
MIAGIIDFVLHIDRHLNGLIQSYGTWTYAILFLIIFAETGLVALPFLPGDSLLFAAGAFAAQGSLDVTVLFFLLAAAAVLGDTANYWIGRVVGPKVFHDGKSRFFKREHLERTHQFYEKYGGRTIIIARFIPIIRTFAPFVAGIGSMSYARFMSYNVFGGIGWIAAFLFSGYYFGTLPSVKNNFTLVIAAIIVISVIPGVIEFLRQRRLKKKEVA